MRLPIVMESQARRVHEYSTSFFRFFFLLQLLFRQNIQLSAIIKIYTKRLTKNILPSEPFKTVCGKRITVPQAQQFVSVHGNDTTVSLPPVSNPATPWVVNGKDSSRVLAVIQNTGGRSSRNILICMRRNDSGSIKLVPFLFAAKTF
ncbi:hypothetical protein CDAR_436781 [Caerostris darwini]|uniref:Uncharacterized protein n=1 Tax=Caerostris darwini TaxID=1538125 RepID=A0AAV4SRR4_9ARAC|nr:hypothetical protein CDAR_436781 [Caerostris darwini]